MVENKKIIGILSMRDLYDYAHNELQDSLKKHQEFMFERGMAVNLKIFIESACIPFLISSLNTVNQSLSFNSDKLENLLDLIITVK